MNEISWWMIEWKIRNQAQKLNDEKKKEIQKEKSEECEDKSARKRKKRKQRRSIYVNIFDFC